MPLRSLLCLLRIILRYTPLFRMVDGVNVESVKWRKKLARSACVVHGAHLTGRSKMHIAKTHKETWVPHKSRIELLCKSEQAASQHLAVIVDGFQGAQESCHCLSGYLSVDLNRPPSTCSAAEANFFQRCYQWGAEPDPASGPMAGETAWRQPTSVLEHRATAKTSEAQAAQVCAAGQSSRSYQRPRPKLALGGCKPSDAGLRFIWFVSREEGRHQPVMFEGSAEWRRIKKTTQIAALHVPESATHRQLLGFLRTFLMSSLAGLAPVA